jgi:hypothetical protein
MSWALALTLGGCQPYLDHERDLFDFRADVTDFGSERQLELKSLEGDQQSLLLVFNQPLREPTETDLTAPFQLTLQPATAAVKLELEGVAGVRATFSQPLAAATEYTVGIPAGWRAQTGVALWRPVRRQWSTPRPELSQVKVDGQPEAPPGAPLRLGPDQAIELVFNQPVAQGSVQEALSWQAAEDAPGPVAAGDFSLAAVVDGLGKKDHRRFRLLVSNLRENTTYRLSLSPGVKGVQGPLRGNRGQTFLFEYQRHLRYLGPTKLPRSGSVALDFSSLVTPEEVARCLVTVPTEARPLIAPDSTKANRITLQFPHSRPRRLLLLAGMESQQRHRLEEDVSIELTAPAPKEQALPPLVPLALSEEIARPAKTRTEVWRLSLDQALAASLTPDRPWKANGALPWERSKPAFVVDPKPLGSGSRARAATRAKPGNGWPAAKKGSRQGLLALRRGGAGGPMERGLVVDTSLHLVAVSDAEGVRVKVLDIATRRPVVGCTLGLRGARAGSAFGATVKSDSAGVALLPWGASSERPEPLFLVAQLGKDLTFTPVRTVGIEPSAALLAAAFLTTDRPFYAAKQPVQVGGFLWKKPSRAVTATLNLYAPDGQLAHTSPVAFDEAGFLTALCSAPEQEGRYRLKLEIGGAEQAHADIRVCPVAVEQEDYSLAVTEEGGSTRAVLTRQGARHRKPGLRAFLLPLAGPSQTTAQGWTPVQGHEPAWESLATSVSAKEIVFQIPQRATGGMLVVEAFDSKEPALVLARYEQEVPPTEPALAVDFKQGTPGQQRIIPKVVGWQGAAPQISGALMFRPRGAQEWQETEVRAQLGSTEQESWNLRFSGPGEYRLQLRASSSVGAPAIEAAWERDLTSEEMSDPGISVEPNVAIPGATLLTTLGASDGGREVWFSLTGGGLLEGRFATVSKLGELPPLIVTFARSLAVRVRAEAPTRPVFGRQRAAWISRSALVPMGLPPNGQVDLSLTVEREDRLQELPRTGQNLRLSLQRGGPGDGWKGMLFHSPSLPGWPAPEPGLASSFLGDSPVEPTFRESYPLLPPAEPERPTLDVISLEANTEIVLAAPSRPGSFRWRAVARDDLGRFAWADQVVEIGNVSRWSASLPWGARVGDSFEAGIKFVSGPTESAALGLTATALVGEPNLTPSGYLRTAGVVKPGGSYFLGFTYSLEQQAKDRVSLAWELGHGGKLHQQDATLEMFPTAPVPRGSGVASLPAGAVRRVPVVGKEPWRLSLRSPEEGEESVIELLGPKGSLGKVRLVAGAAPVTLQGAGPGTLELSHRGGAAITYEMSRLEPDQGETRPWASQVYLFRYLVDQAGRATDSAVKGKNARIRLHLVNPAQLKALRVNVPLPGGLRPVALEPVRDNTPDPAWRVQPGSVEFDLENLGAGEYEWDLEAEVESVGDYLWPTAQATTPEVDLQALSGSGRLTVSAK